MPQCGRALVDRGRALDGALTVGSPLLMVWFLSAKTGKPLLERQLAETKPGYADYMRRTSGFFPLPPREG